jgi:hypothetical protein
MVQGAAPLGDKFAATSIRRCDDTAAVGDREAQRRGVGGVSGTRAAKTKKEQRCAIVVPAAPGRIRLVRIAEAGGLCNLGAGSRRHG